MVNLSKVDVSVERRVLSNLIMSDSLMAKCFTLADPSIFESSLSRIVGGWIWDFYRSRGEAAKEAIEDIYTLRCGELQDADAAMVAEYLKSASDAWKPTNEAYAADMAVKYFRRRGLAKLHEELGRVIDNDDPSLGEKLVADYVRPEVRESSSVSLLDDATAISYAFDNEEETLFTMPGELGVVIGPIIRGDFITLLAPPKRGKTWGLISISNNAVYSGCNTLFVSLEMSREQMVRRFWQYLSGCSRYGEDVVVSEFVPSGDDHWTLVQKQSQTKAVDTSRSAVTKIQDKIKRISRKARIRLMNFPTNSFNVRDLKNELKNLEVYEGFVPDVIVVDYADIMLHGNGNDDRSRLNETWKSLRGIASEYKCALITASQTGRESVGGMKDASENNVSDDIRKIAHCTKAITLNATEREQADGLMRVGCKTIRDGAVIHDQVLCTSCLAIGRLFLDTRFLSTIDTLSQEDAEDVARSRFSRRR